MMENRDRSTEWALLFPLKAGLFAMRSSISSKSVNREKERFLKEKCAQSRHRIRRGSSLSDLDKLQSSGTLPDIVRSTEKGSESVPHSPALSRTNLQLANQVRGSIGDLMNLKKYGGSNWSVRSETLIAKVVPLSTVTPKSPPIEREPEDLELDLRENLAPDEFRDSEPLTCAQRTQRLSRLIRRQRATTVLSPCALKKNLCWAYLDRAIPTSELKFIRGRNI
ncbi:uncharacterized protein LOC112494993 [Cephus cinctus]|uniref:Uncharacterized protein LOC112494993 n=1 Tax=Cephus cinctus TaxID=211228 RepID=A0AAJ7W5E4_CEPCN|nr:uncharacterized protein LOC112494993 [Cephus cinctus]